MPRHYLLDASGTFDTSLDANGFPSKGDCGNGFLKVSTSGAALAVADYFEPSNTASELYNSNQAANSRDHFGNGNKFITPLVVNGKVYVGTPGAVAVFGLLP